MQVINDNGILIAHEQAIPANAAFPIEVTFELCPQQRELLDNCCIEVDAKAEGLTTWYPCLRTIVTYIRGTSIRSSLNAGRIVINNDWLAKNVRTADQARLDAAQTLARGAHSIGSEINGRKLDVWVNVNRSQTELVERWVPKSSAGRFFQRHSDGDKTGRLQLGEWLRKLLSDHQNCSVTWFDPYMEDVGVNLLNQYGAQDARYLILTRAAKKKTVLNEGFNKKTGATEADIREEEKEAQRITNLTASCEKWVKSIGSIQLCVVGVPGETIHDRMILIRNAKGEPEIGFHLSNSIQLANEKHPLLITPIPLDTLQQVLAYTDSILRRALARIDSGASSGSYSMLFDSRDRRPSPSRLAASEHWLTLEHVGEILSIWLSDRTFVGLQGETLQSQLSEKGYLVDGRLADVAFATLPHGLWVYVDESEDFSAAWNTLATLFAHTSYGSTNASASEGHSNKFIEKLRTHLDPNKSDGFNPEVRQGQIYGDMVELLSTPLESQLSHKRDRRLLLHWDNLVDISWGDCYAIRMLWEAVPSSLIRWMEACVALKYRNNVRVQRCLKFAIGQICQDVADQPSQTSTNALLGSSIGYVRMLGLTAFDARLRVNGDLLNELDSIPAQTDKERVQILGWLIKDAPRQQANPQRKALIQALLQALPRPIPDGVLVHTMNALRGTLGELGHELLDDVVSPLLSSLQATTKQFAAIWLSDALRRWSVKDERDAMLFREYEHGFTEQLAILLASADAAGQKDLFHQIRRQVDTCARIIERPLSQDISSKAHHRAMVASLWVEALCLRVLAFLPRPNRIEEAVIYVLGKTQRLRSRWSELEWMDNGKEDLIEYRNKAADVFQIFKDSVAIDQG